MKYFIIRIFPCKLIVLFGGNMRSVLLTKHVMRVTSKRNFGVSAIPCGTDDGVDRMVMLESEKLRQGRQAVISSQFLGFRSCKKLGYKSAFLGSTHYAARECSCIVEIKWGIE
jgi:hypothetical protein